MISDKLKEIRENAGMNKKEFANYIGVKYTTYNGYETGAREPDSDFLILISKKFDVSTDYILGLQTESNVLHSYSLKASEYSHIEKYRSLDDYGRETVDLILERESQRTSTIADQADRIEKLEKTSTLIELHPNHEPALFVLPYFRGGVSAGTGVFILGNEAEDEIELPNLPQYQGADFAIDVTGKSMEPDFMDGDVALVSQSQEMLSGDIGVFVVNGEAFIKELGDKELISKNKQFPNIPFHEGDNIVCMGKVIGKVEMN